MTQTRNSIGKTLFVAQALPATNDKAGFEALTWVQVKGLQVLPQLGITHASIDIPDLATGFTSAGKGAGSGVESTMSFRMVPSDPGQIDLREQSDDGQGYLSIMILTGSDVDSGDGPIAVTGDPVQYAQGFAHSYTENQGDTTTHEGFTVSFRQNALTITDVHPTVV